jgi:hypothetical protein
LFLVFISIIRTLYIAPIVMEDGKKDEEGGALGLGNASSFLVGGLAQRAGLAAASKVFHPHFPLAFIHNSAKTPF